MLNNREFPKVFMCVVAGLVTMFVVAARPSIICADVIRLQHGGEVRGELQNDTQDQTGPVEIRTLSGAVVQLNREGIEFVHRRSRVVEEYVTMSKQIPDTIEAHRELAEWCRMHLLKDERAEQLELLLELDPDDQDARKVLGHVKHNGEWMTRDEMMISRGYVKYNRKWITTQERDLLEKSAEVREAEVVWYPKVRLWFGWITGKNFARKEEGIKLFEEMTDAHAVPALTQVMADHASDDVRMLYTLILGNLEGMKAVPAIVNRYLYDSNPAIRQKAFEVLEPEQFEVALPILVAALKNPVNAVVGNAALALGKIGDPVVIPALIDALVTTHKYQVQVPTGNAVSFGTASNGRTGTVNPYSNTVPPEIEAMARTGQLPYGAIVVPHSATPQLTKTTTVKVDLKNPNVLTALEALTRQNLGYNERDWQLWWSLQKG